MTEIPISGESCRRGHTRRPDRRRRNLAGLDPAGRPALGASLGDRARFAAELRRSRAPARQAIGSSWPVGCRSRRYRGPHRRCCSRGTRGNLLQPCLLGRGAEVQPRPTCRSPTPLHRSRTSNPTFGRMHRCVDVRIDLPGGEACPTVDAAHRRGSGSGKSIAGTGVVVSVAGKTVAITAASLVGNSESVEAFSPSGNSRQSEGPRRRRPIGDRGGEGPVEYARRVDLAGIRVARTTAGARLPRWQLRRARARNG